MTGSRWSSSRRKFLREATALGVTASTLSSGCLYLIGVRQREQIGKKGEPISFESQRNRIRKADATVVVHNRSQLINAIGQQGSIVWVPEDTTIDMTGTMGEIANNVVIASNRNLNDGSGGLIKTDDQKNIASFISENENTHFRVTGIRLKGPRTDHFDPVLRGRSTYDYDVTGFRAYGKALIVDNCEAFGWTNAAFVSGTKQTPTQGWFHHNSFHHNRMAHLGYPMDLFNGEHLIEWNYFNANRHSIAGYGYSANGYEARFNVVGPQAVMHAFDMHHLGENRDDLLGTKRGRMGGMYVNIHHNVFELNSHPAFSIQGIPEQHARFAHNWCGKSKNDPGNIVLYPDNADAIVEDNVYGQDDTELQAAREWLLTLQHQLSQRSEAVFPTIPSPKELDISLPITEEPTLSDRSVPTASTSSPNISTTSSDINSITGMALTPVGGDL